MKDSQHALYETVLNFVTSNGRADIAIGGLGVAVGAASLHRLVDRTASVAEPVPLVSTTKALQ